MSTPRMNVRFVRNPYTRQEDPAQQELVLARNIQCGLLPHRLPTSPYFEVHAFTMPSAGVGGDYYDAVSLPGGQFGFAVADVSGKGLPAAILSANLQGAFAIVAADDLELPETFSRVNEFLYARSSEEMYATMFYGILSPNGDFNFVNAGHTHPLIVGGNEKVQRQKISNSPLGLFPGAVEEFKLWRSKQLRKNGKDRPVSPATTNRALTTLKRIFNYADALWINVRNPCAM